MAYLSKYTTYEEFFETLSPVQQKIAALLRDLLLTAAPDMREKISYGLLPFYFRYSRIFYIGPDILDKEAIELGFCEGYQMKDKHRLLVARGRKQVAGIVFKTVEDVYAIEEALLETIEEAVRLDEALKKRKK